jgi:uncharacterized protein YggE
VLEQPHISVNGLGMASGMPDQCRLQIALNHMSDTAAGALSGTSDMASKALAALSGLTAEDDEVHTIGLTVQEFFDQATQKVTAHVGSYRMDVLVRPIERAGQVLSELAGAVGDGFQIRGIDLSLQDPEPLKSLARRMAVQDAKRRAAELTDEAGVQLGDLISIQDESALVGNGRRATPTSAAFAGSYLPIEGGDVSLVSAVRLTYAIGR